MVVLLFTPPATAGIVLLASLVTTSAAAAAGVLALSQAMGVTAGVAGAYGTDGVAVRGFTHVAAPTANVAATTTVFVAAPLGPSGAFTLGLTH